VFFIIGFVAGTFDCQCNGVQPKIKALGLQPDFTAGVAVKTGRQRNKPKKKTFSHLHDAIQSDRLTASQPHQARQGQGELTKQGLFQHLRIRPSVKTY
jgi:hypothetical protein